MRSRIEGTEVINNVIRNQNRFGVSVQTLAATYAIPSGAPHVQALDPGGAARNVTLPASPRAGDWFLIINAADAAEVITVQTSAAAALVPPITPTQSESALVVYINATLGWRGLVAIGV